MILDFKQHFLSLTKADSIIEHKERKKLTWKRKRKVRVSQGERKGASKEMEEESFAFLKVRNSITNKRKDRKNNRQKDTKTYLVDRVFIL